MPGNSGKIGGNSRKCCRLLCGSGGKGKRLALINNQSFAEGETAMIKLGDSKLKVVCKEIRDHSVLVQIDGKPEVELVLGKTSIPAKTDSR